jgi:replication factor C large subunit
MTEPWVHKYAAKTREQIVCHGEQINRIISFIKDFRKQKRKAILLTGPSGIGKTSIAHAVANDLGLEIIEINASDVRNKDSILSIIGQASRQQSLFGKGKVILVDEVDGLSGTGDRGGIPALVTVIANTSFPIIMTAASLDDDRISPLKKVSQSIELEEPDYHSVFSLLKEICGKESVVYDESSLKTLARRNGCDIRAAINDLQTLSGGKQLTRESMDSLSDRRQLESIQEALLKIFKPSGHEIALRALENVDMDLDTVMMWLDENLPREYRKPEDLVRAYDHLSRADVYKGRIRRWQHWRFMVYVEALATAGIASAKDERLKEPVDYIRSKRPLRIWMANQRFMKRKAIVKKISEKTHTSYRRALQDTYPYVREIIRRDNDSSLPAYLELEDDEIAWLKK